MQVDPLRIPLAPIASRSVSKMIAKPESPVVSEPSEPRDDASLSALRALSDQALRDLTEKAIQAGLSGQLLGALGAALHAGLATTDKPSAVNFPLLQNPGGSLDDVGGLSDAKATMGDLVNSFRSQSQELTSDGSSLGPAKLPYKGYLIHGWSGSGKSHLVKSLAGELNALDVPVIEATAGDFARKTDDGNGTGPDRLANLFAFARKTAMDSPNKGAVLVLEDIDALFPIRGDSNPTGNQMVTSFSSEMDRLAKDPEVSVAVIGLTSRKDLVDISAANRMEKEVFLMNPRDAKERQEIMDKVVEQNGWKLETASMLKDLAESTPGRTSRELKSILQAAAAESEEVISEKTLAEARMTHFYGPAQPVNTPQWFFRLSVAHELGHAVIRHFMDGIAEQDQRPDGKLQAIDQLIFQPRGGSAASISLKYSGNPSKSFDYYFGEIASNYGGRAAEYLFGNGHLSAGPGNDIQFASLLANEAITEKGMGPNTGPVNPNYAKVAEGKVEEDISALLKSADETSTKIVKFYQDFIGSQAENYAARASAQGTDSLVMSGGDFKSLLGAWEAGKETELNELRQEIRAIRDQGRPTLAGHDALPTNKL